MKFFCKGIDAVLEANAGVALAQGRGGNADVPHPAMSGGSRQPGQVEQRTATSRHEVGMPIEAMAFDGLVERGNVGPRVLCRLPAGATIGSATRLRVSRRAAK